MRFAYIYATRILHTRTIVVCGLRFTTREIALNSQNNGSGNLSITVLQPTPLVLVLVHLFVKVPRPETAK